MGSFGGKTDKGGAGGERPRSCASVISRYYSLVATKQLAISMEEDLVARVRKAAKRSRGGNVSAWLAEAAAAQLRHEEAREILEELIAEQGPVSDGVLAKVRRQWPED